MIYPENINQIIAQAKREREEYIVSTLSVGALPVALAAAISLFVAQLTSTSMPESAQAGPRVESIAQASM